MAVLRSATAQYVGSKQTYATMRKSALIATCLTNSAMAPDVNAGEAAVRQVFPALCARLKDRFVELVHVDLRCGVTVEQAERGEVLPICLAEIDRARPYSLY